MLHHTHVHDARWILLSPLFGVLVPAGARADDYEPCSYAEARSAAEAFIAGVSINVDKGFANGGVAAGVDRCQFRGFWGGTVCFGEDDWFIDGSVWYEISDPLDGLSYQDARAGAAGYYATFSLTDAAGNDIPVVSEATPVKSTLRQDRDQMFVWSQHYTMLHLAPGDYYATLTDGHVVWGPFDPVTMRVRVFPREEAEALGAPPFSDPTNWGSVNCPDE